MSGVAIIGASAEARVDKGVLQAHAHKIRAGVSCVPDLILSRAGNTAAFILLDRSAVPDISVKDLERIKELGKSFSHSFVLASAPLDKCSAPQYFDLALGDHRSDVLMFGTATNLTQKAIDVLATMLDPMADTPEELDARRLSLVHDRGGAGSFSKLPSFILTEAEAESLTLCGSIKDLTLCTAHDIVSYTELSYERAEELLNFFGNN